MNYEHANLVIPLVAVATLRDLAKMLDRNETDNMFIVGLSPTGELPATHFISTGPVPADFALNIRSDALLYTKGQAAFLKEKKVYPYTAKQVKDALAGCTVTDGKKKIVKNAKTYDVPESAFALLDRLGLKLIRGTI